METDRAIILAPSPRLRGCGERGNVLPVASRCAQGVECLPLTRHPRIRANADPRKRGEVIEGLMRLCSATLGGYRRETRSGHLLDML